MELTVVAPPRPTAPSGAVALRITVLAGGPSAEREVSLDSGRAIADALRRRGHAVHLADISPEDLSALDQPADVVFPALHGTWGEDGQLQAILERRGLPFVGSGSCASRLAMDKLAAKRAVAALGLDTPAFEMVTSASAPAWAPRLPPPLIVKPVDQGSSVLTVVAPRQSDARRGVEAVVARFGRALVERFIAGDEITVGIIDGEPLPPICVRPKSDFYDYDAKYRDDRTEYLFDAGHGAALYRRAAENSARVFAALGCRHLARVDWIADRAGRLWFLEVNTLPGFTSHSLVPKAAARAGMSFDELVDRLARRPLRGGDV